VEIRNESNPKNSRYADQRTGKRRGSLHSKRRQQHIAIFKRRHLHKVLSRQKTQTRRIHKYTWKLGKTYSIRDRWFSKPQGHIIITRKFKQRLGDISESDIKKEGFNSLEEFKKEWEECYGPGSWNPNTVVTAYEFKLKIPELLKKEVRK